MFTQESGNSHSNASRTSPRDSVTSVSSLESSMRKGSGMRLPPLSHERTSSNATAGSYNRESSGESVTSARKVNVDVKPSPGLVRTHRIGDIES